MKQKYHIPSIIVAIAVIVAGIFIYLNYPQNQQTDPNCNWTPGLCKNICQSQNYYFDSVSKECKKYMESDINKGCCTPPPFETLEECKSACG